MCAAAISLILQRVRKALISSARQSLGHAHEQSDGKALGEGLPAKRGRPSTDQRPYWSRITPVSSSSTWTTSNGECLTMKTMVGILRCQCTDQLVSLVPLWHRRSTTKHYPPCHRHPPLYVPHSRRCPCHPPRSGQRHALPLRSIRGPIQLLLLETERNSEGRLWKAIEQALRVTRVFQGSSEARRTAFAFGAARQSSHSTASFQHVAVQPQPVAAAPVPQTVKIAATEKQVAPSVLFQPAVPGTTAACSPQT